METRDVLARPGLVLASGFEPDALSRLLTHPDYKHGSAPPLHVTTTAQVRQLLAQPATDAVLVADWGAIAALPAAEERRLWRHLCMHCQSAGLRVVLTCKKACDVPPPVRTSAQLVLAYGTGLICGHDDILIIDHVAGTFTGDVLDA